MESLVGSTKYFSRGGEALGNRGTQVRYPFSYISGLSKLARRGNFIFHLKPYHLTIDRKPAIDPHLFLEKLCAHGWKVIHLRRENKFLQVLSWEIRLARGKAQKYDDSLEKIRLKIDPREMKSRILWRQGIDLQEEEALKGIEHFKVVYERDLEHEEKHQTTIDSITDYLGLEKRPAQSRLKKINRYHPSEIIENYEEVKQMLIENGWEKYIV